MIRRLTLRNWRNYEDVSLTLDRGTTFIVARNGVGKSSLVEAARYAIFGVIANPAAAIRVGLTTAEATVEIELPNQRILTINRVLTAAKTTKRTPPPAPTVTLDGAPVTTDQFTTLVTTEYGTEPEFLSRLTMPPATADLDTPDSMGLDEHLGRFYGVHNLRAAATELTAQIKALEKRVSNVKTSNAASAKQLDTLTTAVKQAEHNVAEATTNHEQIRTQVDAAQRHQLAQEQAATWLTQSTERTRQLAELADKFARATGDPAEPDDTLLDTIDHTIDESRTTLNTIDVRAGILQATADTLRVNLERLNNAHEAHDDCPVCRRTLDDDTAATAAQATTEDLASIAAELATLADTRAATDQTHAAIQDLRTRARTIQTLPPRPATTLPDDNETPHGELDLAALTELQTTRIDQLVTARANLETAQRTLQAAQDADEAMRELTTMFAQLATLTVALRATEATLDDILNNAVKPLASAINERWTKLFPDRGSLDTTADGTVTRSVLGHALPFSSFSAGESAGLNLLIRLVVAHMATHANFCWFDEPLEHMDPDTRRHVASMLARAADGDGPMTQIVLTTYEDTLARHLERRDPRHVHIQDVRQQPFTAQGA